MLKDSCLKLKQDSDVKKCNNERRAQKSRKVKLGGGKSLGGAWDIPLPILRHLYTIHALWMWSRQGWGRTIGRQPWPKLTTTICKTSAPYFYRRINSLF